MKKMSMAKLSVIVSVLLFTILTAAIVIILDVSGRINGSAAGDRPFRVGLILSGSKDDNSLNSSHYEPLVKVTEELGAELVYRENVAGADECAGVIREFAEEEYCGIIAAASPVFTSAVNEAAEKYPGIFFMQFSGTGSGRNLCSFDGRMYQIRYLSGIIAGYRTKSGKIGYAASLPTPDVKRGINAFALGVRSVSPDAEVIVSFCNSQTDYEAAARTAEKLIKEQGADVLAMHTDTPAPLDVAEKYGIKAIGYNCCDAEKYAGSCIADCVWDWEDFYREQIKNCGQGTFAGGHRWLDYNSGVISLRIPEDAGLSAECEAALRAAEQNFASYASDVFYGPVRDNTGVLRVAEDESMSDDALQRGFDWYAEGVRIAE